MVLRFNLVIVIIFCRVTNFDLSYKNEIEYYKNDKHFLPLPYQLLDPNKSLKTLNQNWIVLVSEIVDMNTLDLTLNKINQ